MKAPIKVHINHAGDLSDGLSFHPWSPPGIPIPISLALHAEAEVPMDRGQAANNLSWSVLYCGVGIVREGHDSGSFIRDKMVGDMFGMMNGMYLLFWPFSARKIAYAASTVVINGVAVGCADMTCSFPLTMMTCGIITAPSARPTTNSGNTVFVGMTAADLLLGILGIALAIAIDILAIALSLGGKLPDGLLKILRAILEKFLDTDPMKWLLAVASGAILGITRWLAGGRKGKLTITLPSPSPRAPSPRLIYDPDKGTWSVDPGLDEGRRVPKSRPETAPPEAVHPLNTQAHPADGPWGDSLEPPDDRPGWAHDPERGWVRP